ncbi:AAA domain-containing protein [Streptomyces sp. NPDC007206]|uniref:serine/threonine-protein kinase n=1 Tax=Streptomyces sp. NPDC007206 TaxID=3154317 RepID=UPI00340D36AD
MIGGRFVLDESDAPRVGGHAEVRKAFDTREGILAAIKLLRPQGNDDDGVVRLFFERETETLRSLQHENIVRIVDSGWSEEHERYFMALEWVERSLRDDVLAGKTFTWNSFFEQIGKPLVKALSYAHFREIEHRDVKPGNLLISPEGTLKLADFGIAKVLSKVTDPQLTVAGWGSGLYAPPEHEEALPYVRDVFSYGVVAIQVLSGEQARTYADLRPVLEGILDIPAELRAILSACVSLDAEERPANATLLEQQLLDAEQVRHNRQVRSSHRLWFKLTRKAAQSLDDAPEGSRPDFRRAEAKVLADLSGTFHVDYGFLRESQREDRDTLIFLGREYRLVAKEDVTYPECLAIVGATRVEEDKYGAWRERALSIKSLVSCTFENPGESAALAGLDLITDALDRHHEEKNAPTDVPEGEGVNDLFAGWRRLLEAREDLARGARQPLRYDGFEQRGRTIDFDLIEECDALLLGDEWEVAHALDQRPLERGEVVEQSEKSVSVRFRSPTVKLPRRGVLLPYLGPSKVALQRQQDALSSLRTGRTTNPKLADIIADPASLSVSKPAEITHWFRGDLDPSKQNVVRHALGTQDLLLVEGPPGTGKTTVIAEIVEQTLARTPEARILIVSQTHIAIDNALHRLEQANIPDLVRLGRPDDPRVAVDVKHLLLDQQLKRWSKSVRKQALAFLDHQAKLHGVPTRHLAAALELEELASVLANIDVVRRRIDELSNSTRLDGATVLRNRAEELVTARDRLNALLEAQKEHRAAAISALAGDLTLPPELSTTDARAAVAVLIDEKGASQFLMNLLRLQGEWLQRIETDSALTASFLNTRKVVAGTALGFLGHPAARDLEFDLCIFDEASKATATEALVPLARARRWILVGDTRQLPPVDEEILRNKVIMQDHQLTPQLVETTLFQYLANRTKEPAKHQLREQYRMTPAIGNMISACFYDDLLLSPNPHALPNYYKISRPVRWIDTSRLGGKRRESERTAGERSIANWLEAKLAVKQLSVIDGAVERRIIQPPGDRKLQVLVIAPYGRQVEDLRRRVSTLRLSHLTVEVLSVDAVQGRECDLAMFTVTRSNDRGDFGFLGEPYWRRINVALSRARYGLTIIGDAEFCRSKPGALRRVLEYIGDHPQDCEMSDADLD